MRGNDELQHEAYEYTVSVGAKKLTKQFANFKDFKLF